MTPRGGRSLLCLPIKAIPPLRAPLVAQVFCILLATAATAGAQTITLEAEDGTLVGTFVSTSTPGYSGTGYATSFEPGDYVAWTFNASPGLYRLLIRYRIPAGWGDKGFEGLVNGSGVSGMFANSPAFATFDAGLVGLESGVNTAQIGGGWNYYEIDKIDFVPEAPPLPPLPVDPTPVNSNATFAARELLKDLAADYGTYTWSGQQETTEVGYVYNVSGEKPLIVSGDLINYSPSRIAHGENPGTYSEGIIAQEDAGHVISMSWHWNAPSALVDAGEWPWWRGFYTQGTTFDLVGALADTNSTEYGEILRDIDAIAVQLQKFQAAGIPVLWRPMHEASGGWFWWGAHGPAAFKELWRLLYDRLTDVHDLNNLIWVLNNEDPAWYPGDDVADIVSVDGYPADRGDALSGRWEAMKAQFDGEKIIALSEFGGVPDIEKMHAYGVWWAYFVPWTSDNGPPSEPDAKVIRIYQSPDVITLDEMNARPPLVLSIQRDGGAGIELTGRGRRGGPFSMRAAADAMSPPASWPEIGTGVCHGGVFTYVDPPGTNTGPRVYHLQQSL